MMFTLCVNFLILTPESFSMAFPKFLTDCTSHVFSEVNMVRQELFGWWWHAWSTSKALFMVNWIFQYFHGAKSLLCTVSSVWLHLWRYWWVLLMVWMTIVFLTHHKKRGCTEMVSFTNLQQIHAAVALFNRNVGIGVWCHPPSCSVVGVEDGCSAELLMPVKLVMFSCLTRKEGASSWHSMQRCDG